MITRDDRWLQFELAAEVAWVVSMAFVGGFVGVMYALTVLGFLAWFTHMLRLWGRGQRRPIRAVWKDRISRWGLLERPGAVDVALVVASVAALWMVDEVGVWLYEGSSSAVGDPTLDTWTAIVAGEKGLQLQATYVLLIVVVGPLCEEIAWRAYALRGLEAVLKTSRVAPGVALWLALTCSSVAFGAAHMQYSLYGQVIVGISGLVYGLLLIRTRNLLLAALAHGLHNGLWVVGCLIA